MLAYQLGEGERPRSGVTWAQLWPWLAGGLVAGVIIAAIVLTFFS
jgi:hypothetical protein